MKFLRAMLLAAFLSGCAERYIQVCPPLKEYPPAFTTAVVNELKQLPEGDPLITTTGDYHALRKAIEDKCPATKKAA